MKHWPTWEIWIAVASFTPEALASLNRLLIWYVTAKRKRPLLCNPVPSSATGRLPSPTNPSEEHCVAAGGRDGQSL